jgi:hypothetical protein
LIGGDAVDVVDPESLADQRVRGLLETYARAIGAAIRAVSPHLLEIVLPPPEREFFASRPRLREHGILRVGVTLEALDADPDAELAVVGSPLFEHLVDAIRARGHRISMGVLPATLSPAAEAAQLEVPIHAAAASQPEVKTAVHPIGRLLVRVLVRAGAAAEELLVESAMFDLASGRQVDSGIAALCGPAGETQQMSPVGSQWLPEQPVDRLLALMVSDLEARLRPDFDKRRGEAERSLAAELGRIDAYYKSLLEGPAGVGTDIKSAEERTAFEAEHRRRRDEEIRRHQLRATLHPVQLTRWGLLVQDATWQLATSAGRHGTFTATRALSGEGGWEPSCPSCGLRPGTLSVCKYDHVACGACSHDCVVCGESICREHAPQACHVDGAGVCDSHARICLSCRRGYCTQHQTTCSDGDHPICIRCSVACGVCGRQVCTGHAEMSAAGAPKGERALCATCVVLCEGGRNEPVGRDEVVRCATCDRHVCGGHQASCSVDGRVHCSSHLRRADKSRRLVCEKHQATCAHEPNAVFATDEVGGCGACLAVTCHEHAANCSIDGARYCRSHLAPLVDKGSAPACERHRSRCYIDGQSYSLGTAESCSICTETTCKEHLRSCAHCARSVCFKDFEMRSGRCSTCRRLGETDIPVEMMAAAIAANGGISPKAKTWNVARDKTSTVVDVDLGWSRHLVFTVRHGEEEPATVVQHSLLSSKRSK